jgi:hypothetical protein
MMGFEKLLRPAGTGCGGTRFLDISKGGGR